MLEKCHSDGVARFGYPIFITGGFPCGGTVDGPMFPDFLTIPGRPLVFAQYDLKGQFVDPGPEAPKMEVGFRVHRALGVKAAGLSE
jgi:hypothetical protein